MSRIVCKIMECMVYTYSVKVAVQSTIIVSPCFLHPLRGNLMLSSVVILSFSKRKFSVCTYSSVIFPCMQNSNLINCLLHRSRHCLSMYVSVLDLLHMKQ